VFSIGNNKLKSYEEVRTRSFMLDLKFFEILTADSFGFFFKNDFRSHSISGIKARAPMKEIKIDQNSSIYKCSMFLEIHSRKTKKMNSEYEKYKK